MTALSPFGRRLVWFTAAMLLPVPILMRWVDGPLAVQFQTYHETLWWKFFSAITYFANGFIWYSLALIGLLSAWVRHRMLEPPSSSAVYDARRRAWLFMIAAMATSGFAEILVKFVLGRDRPRVFLRDGTIDFHPFRLRIADSSFPSGHTQSICSAMLALSIIYPPLRAGILVDGGAGGGKPRGERGALPERCRRRRLAGRRGGALLAAPVRARRAFASAGYCAARACSFCSTSGDVQLTSPSTRPTS